MIFSKACFCLGLVLVISDFLHTYQRSCVKASDIKPHFYVRFEFLTAVTGDHEIP
jgi:hypothetical protein